MTYRILRFGDAVLPDYNEEAPIGVAVSAKTALDIPSGGALDLFGGERVMHGNIKITKSCTLHATTENSLLAQLMAWRVLVGTRGMLYRERIASGVLEWAWARLENLDVTRRYGQMSKFFQDARLSFTIYSPAWYSETTHSYATTVAPSGSADLATVLAESGTNVLRIDHTGNIDQPAAIFTFTAIGSVTHVSVNNTTTGYNFGYTGSLASGDVLVIDTGAMSVLNNGVDDYAHFNPPANKEDWMHIAPGENKLLVTVTGGGNLSLVYYAAFA